MSTGPDSTSGALFLPQLPTWAQTHGSHSHNRKPYLPILQHLVTITKMEDQPLSRLLPYARACMTGANFFPLELPSSPDYH